MYNHKYAMANIWLFFWNDIFIMKAHSTLEYNDIIKRRTRVRTPGGSHGELLFCILVFLGL